MRRVKEYYVLRTMSIVLLSIMAITLIYTFGLTLLLGVGSKQFASFLLIMTTFIIAPLALGVEMVIKENSL